MKKFSTVIFLLVLIILLLLGCQKSSNEKLETQKKEIPVTTVVTEPSSDWVEYRNNESGVYSYKKVNIDKDIVQVWVKQVFSDKIRKNIIQEMKGSGISTKGWDKLSGKKMSIEQDCKKHRERILSMTIYDSDGKVLQSSEDHNTDWKDIILDSPVGVSHKIFCK